MDVTVISIATVLATVFAGLKLYLAFRDKKPRVKVNLEISLIFRGLQGLGVIDNGIEAVLTIRNSGQKTAFIEQAGIELPNGMIFNSIANIRNFPAEILSGKSLTVKFNAVDLLGYLKDNIFDLDVKIRGFVKDELGYIYKSSKISFNSKEIEMWKRALDKSN